MALMRGAATGSPPILPATDEIKAIVRFSALLASSRGEKAFRRLCGPTTFALRFWRSSAAERSESLPYPRRTPALNMASSSVEVCFASTVTAF